MSYIITFYTIKNKKGKEVNKNATRYNKNKTYLFLGFSIKNFPQSLNVINGAEMLGLLVCNSAPSEFN